MAKKKKTQLKPVARGFATTSVPKKIAPANLESSEATAESRTAQSDLNPSLVEPLEVAESSQTRGAPQADPEQEYLQACIDKHQERTEREINRTVKVSSAFRNRISRRKTNELEVHRARTSLFPYFDAFAIGSNIY